MSPGGKTVGKGRLPLSHFPHDFRSPLSLLLLYGYLPKWAPVNWVIHLEYAILLIQSSPPDSCLFLFSKAFLLHLDKHMDTRREVGEG